MFRYFSRGLRLPVPQVILSDRQANQDHTGHDLWTTSIPYSQKKNQRVFYFSIGELGESSKAVITYNKRVGQN